MEVRTGYGADRPTPDPNSVVLVAGGGVVGATTRWAVFNAIEPAIVGLILVNAAGAFVLGFLARGRPSWPARAHLWLGIGFCGALTTFSTLAVEIAERIERGELRDGASTATVTVAIGLAAAVLGNMVGRHRRARSR